MVRSTCHMADTRNTVGHDAYRDLGSAPDIAGQGIINPTGMILSVAMMLRYSLAMPEAADSIEAAVGKVIEEGCRTSDIGGSASTADFGDAVVIALKSGLDKN
jgi:3-isopropylmalate dehydrogenase